MLQEQIDSHHFGELLVADAMGMLPDPWDVAGTIAAAVVNFGGMSAPKRMVQPEDFRPRRQATEAEKAERLAAINKGDPSQVLQWRT